VRFAHRGGTPVIDGLDLVVEPGQVVAIVGPPGSGKSTLVSLLLRLHDPDAGTIRLDGVDLRDVPRSVARSLVATVLQEPFLYSRTIGHNIRIGLPHATQLEVEDAARAACIHDAIRTFPDGYETLVGERGVTLSGGQRQRVAIARTLLEDAPVLVLDDALSAIDTRTEARIREAIAMRRGRRTCLVIAHRLTTTREADVVVVLRNGRIVQRGTHAQLASVDGPYRRLWDIQSDVEAESMGHAVHAAAMEGGQS
jgi:ATP-binding cassette subfamily B protein